jgi:hypothetical protein
MEPGYGCCPKCASRLKDEAQAARLRLERQIRALRGAITRMRRAKP